MKPTALICLPFAGAGASFFRRWRPSAPDGLTILPVQLPGREERVAEPPHTDVGSAADEACRWAVRQLAGAQRTALFGHSLGAELAYELAWRLLDQGVWVARLFVSGAPGPRNRTLERVSHLDDAGFIDGLQRITGYRHGALDHPEMRAIVLPSLRADTQMHEAYSSAHAERLPIPITSLRGRDDELVTAAQAREWSGETSAGFASVEVGGGHMYLAEAPETVLRTALGELGRDSGGCPLEEGAGRVLG
jgi:surfactin synthase thioesterase subunit